jgi:hypothetical protein
MELKVLEPYCLLLPCRDWGPGLEGGRFREGFGKIVGFGRICFFFCRRELVYSEVLGRV